MSLFDSLVGQVAGPLTAGGGDGDVAGGPAGGLMGVVTQLLTDPQHGGLQGLVQTFQQQGLGQVVASWVGTGQNLPISAEQLSAVLGSEKLQGLAQQVGLNPQELSGQLAQWLPQAVDQLTPQGQVPEAGALQPDALQGALGGLLGKFLGQG
ncbi:MAG: YidB family protein [Aquabacterium commune]|uniref:YidB family protein n=1 Tax=Aquabacterium commune TaxID=70586 RepID=UPI003BAF585D